MEGGDLDILVNLMDDDEDFIERESEHGSLEEKGADSTLNKSNETNNDNNDNEDVARRFSDMEKYIKYLETQLKDKNGYNPSESDKNTAETRSRDLPGVHENKASSKNIKTTGNYNDNNTSNEKEKKDSISTKSKETSSSSKTSSNSQSATQKIKKENVPTESSTTKQTKVPQATTSTPSQKNKPESTTSGKKRKAVSPASRQDYAAKRPAPDMSGVTDGFSGLKILNPLVSSTVMERRMEGRNIIKVSAIQSKITCNNDIEGDWVTIAVLVQKLPPKTSAKGGQYSIWKLSDLAFHLPNHTISLFLFGETHREHWKTAEGSVIALLNPSILPSKEKQSKDAAITIDNPKKMMLMGVSQDFGRCQGARKSDGNKCSNFINKSYGNFCEYHVRREYNKTRSKRMECQQGYGAPSRPPKNKLREKIASETFFYQGKTVSSSAPPPKKEKVSLKTFGPTSGKDHLNFWKEKQGKTESSTVGKSSLDGPSDDFLNLLKMPSVGSRNFMRQLHKEEEEEQKTTQIAVAASDFLKANKVHSPATTVSRPSTRSPANTTPVLGRGLNSNNDVIIFDENMPISLSGSKANDTEKGKRKALALVRETGPFTPQDPNKPRAKKISPKQQKAIIDKLEESTTGPVLDEKVSSFTLAEGFDLESSEGQRILNAKSRHVGQVKQAEHEQEQRYFEAKEKKEEMEDKMRSITKIKVSVLHCSQCQYVSEKPSDMCTSQKHVLNKLKVFKKFFACKNCKQQTVCYGGRYPHHQCRSCGGRNFEKSSLFQEKNGPKVGGETLLLRGPEYTKFLNSFESPRMNGVLPKYL